MPSPNAGSSPPPSNSAAWSPPTQTPVLPGYPPRAPATPGDPSAINNPLANTPLSQLPGSGASTTANPPARSPSSYPSTNLPEIPGTGVMPATSIDSSPRMPSANANPTRLPDPLMDYRDKTNASVGPSATNPGAAANPAGASLPSTAIHPEFTALLQAAYADIARGHVAESHLALSRFYGEPHLTDPESRALVDLLDQLAGTVVYSRQHLLEPPYRVQNDDTLDRIARPYEITPSLLAKINGIRDPQQLLPGRELKVMHGPFDATIDLGRYQMTVFLKDRYAGRFNIGLGTDYLQSVQRNNTVGQPPALEGEYTVRDKQFSPIYYGPDRVTISPSEPSYPLGKRWIDLGSRNGLQIGIHGTNDPRNIGHTAGRGSIYLSERDIDDIYDILTVGSKVTIRR
jgi:LysM repeat protein